MLFRFQQNETGLLLVGLENKKDLPDTLRIQAYGSEMNPRFLGFTGYNIQIYKNQLQFKFRRKEQYYQGSFTKKDSLIISQYFNRLLTYPRDTIQLGKRTSSHGLGWDILYTRDTVYEYYDRIIYYGHGLRRYLLIRPENSQNQESVNDSIWDDYKDSFPLDLIKAWEVEWVGPPEP